MHQDQWDAGVSGAALREGLQGSRIHPASPRVPLGVSQSKNQPCRGNTVLGWCLLVDPCGTMVPLVGLFHSSQSCRPCPPRLCTGELQLLPFTCCHLSII